MNFRFVSEWEGFFFLRDAAEFCSLLYSHLNGGVQEGKSSGKINQWYEPRGKPRPLFRRKRRGTNPEEIRIH